MATLNSSNIPVLPIRNALVFPHTVLSLTVGRKKSISAVRRAQLGDLRILVVGQKVDRADQSVEPSELYRVGTICQLEHVQTDDQKETYRVLARGISRYRVLDFIEEDGVLTARGEEVFDQVETEKAIEGALLKGLKEMSKELLQFIPGDTVQLTQLVDNISDLSQLTHLCAAHIDIPMASKQELLEMSSVKARTLKLMDFMQRVKESLSVQNEIRGKLGQKMGRQQREMILREQLKAIKEELGDQNDDSRNEDYQKKIEDAGMPEETKNIALEELKRLEAVGNNSQESHVIRNYLDLLCVLPWQKSSNENEIDLDKARAILDADHYGLSKIKTRIIQHLAVMKLKKTGKGSILLFVGPPGVGKTSLGQSIARALGRKFGRASLGGVRDDAEIRGHRRTYVGAMPGRIIQSMKRAGENNPVLMLDEIDKMGASFHGDPGSALLEVLDPEQNHAFLDHYLDLPFDLSKVFFIATANSLENIPRPLLDRMEVIELTGYTAEEKLHIAKNHLLAKQFVENGLSAEQIHFSDEALLALINDFTREAGVRNLNRKIGSVLRGLTENVLKTDAKLPIPVEPAKLPDLLDMSPFIHEAAERSAIPGVTTGLAWTPMGGEILFMEAQLMPGSGKLILTGQLGEVMKESAQIALSLVRSKLASIVPSINFEKQDLHIHVPAGAIPKDGPSAGVTMLTTIASLFLNTGVDPRTAMTGEITLRGMVMPVGGIKEKVVAAHRAGINRVILPKRNERDLREIPAEVKQGVKFEFVENANELLRLTLGLESASSIAVSNSGQSSSAHVSAVA